MNSRGVVLVIEDDPETAELIASLLLAESYEPLVSSTAWDGLKGLLKRPVAVLLDWSLPDRPGIEVCRAMRSRDAHLPILFVSGRTDEATVIEGLEAGANDFVFKPFRSSEFIARLHAQIRLAQRQAGSTASALEPETP